MIETIQKLVQLSKAKDNLPAILIEGLVDEYVSKNGEVIFKDRFHSDIENYYKVQYILYSLKHKLHYISESSFKYYTYNWIKHKVTVKEAIINEKQLKLFNSDLLSWYKQFKNVNYNGRIVGEVKSVDTSGLRYYYTKLSECIMRGFRLEIENYYDHSIDLGYHQAIIYIKYKQSKHNHPLIQIALSHTNRPPKSDCYLYLLKFRIDSIEQGERLLQYLHYFIKDLI